MVLTRQANLPAETEYDKAMEKTKLENDKTAELIDLVYNHIPTRLGDRIIDAEYNDDGSIQILIGSEEYNLTIKKER